MLAFLAMKSTDLAKEYWRKIVNKGDLVIDATIGNGHDTFFLAELVGENGRVIGYDIQKKAIENVHHLLETFPLRKIITLHHASHTAFFESKAKLIVYNLGYLPGGDHTITTQSSTTLQSLKNGLNIIEEGGAISLMCYRGHAAGEEEYQSLLTFVATLPKHLFLVCEHKFINREKAPVHLIIRNLQGD